MQTYDKQQLQAYTKKELSKLSTLKNEFGYKDEIMNQFKLMIYEWNLTTAIIYYKQDSFCNDFCIEVLTQEMGLERIQRVKFRNAVSQWIPLKVKHNDSSIDTKESAEDMVSLYTSKIADLTKRK